MKFTSTLLAFLLWSCSISCGGSKVCEPNWTFSAPHQCISQQITVADGVVYCLAGRGDDPYSRMAAESMYALDASDGTPLWDLPLALDESIPSRVHRYAREPLIEAGDGLLCYLRRDGQLKAFSHRTGELLWEVSGVYLLLKINMGVHVMYANSLYAVLDSATGKIRTSTEIASTEGDFYINLPVVADGNSYFITSSVGADRLSAVEVESGRLLWNRQFMAVRFVTVPAPNEALLAKCRDRSSDRVLAFDTKTGQELWSADVPFWPHIDGDIVYYYNPTDTGYHTVGIDTKTGERISDIPTVPWSSHGTPVVSEEVEYSLGYRDHYNALQKALLEGQRTPTQLESMDTWLIAKNANNGEVIWKTSLLWGFGGIPIVRNGFVYQAVYRAGQPPQLLAYRAAHISR